MMNDGKPDEMPLPSHLFSPFEGFLGSNEAETASYEPSSSFRARPESFIPPVSSTKMLPGCGSQLKMGPWRVKPGRFPSNSAL